MEPEALVPFAFPAIFPTRGAGPRLRPSPLLGTFAVITPVALAAEDFQRATQLKWRDDEDRLIGLAALRANVDYIVTRDIKGFERSMVPAITPASLLRAIKDAQGIGRALIHRRNARQDA